MNKVIYLVLSLVIFAALITLCYVFVLFRRVSKIQISNKKVDEIHEYIHHGALTFLKREYKVIIPFIVILAVILTILGFIPALQGAEGVGWQAAICFLIGATFSAVAGWVGMSIATKANARTAIKAQEEGMSSALNTAFSGGAVLGLTVAGIGLFGLAVIFIIGFLLH